MVLPRSGMVNIICNERDRVLNLIPACVEARHPFTENVVDDFLRSRYSCFVGCYNTMGVVPPFLPVRGSLALANVVEVPVVFQNPVSAKEGEAFTLILKL